MKDFLFMSICLSLVSLLVYGLAIIVINRIFKKGKKQ